jgi:hypothetical protein
LKIRFDDLKRIQTYPSLYRTRQSEEYSTES